MAKDEVFAKPRDMNSDFKFDETVTTVFDDMVSRSVPFYEELQRMTGEMAVDFAVDGTNLYDLGCATGTTFLYLDPLVSPGVKFVGIDNSSEMIKKADEKMKEHHLAHAYEFIEADLNKGLLIENASVVVMILTLQFVRPLYRQHVIREVANGLNENGCLILIEKLVHSDSLFNRLFIKYYYDMKRRKGYSEMEISQKREALENVLIPYRMEENRDLLLSEGFRYCEEFFRWYNFCGMVAVK
ncbi:MAG: carboxy-S-adenosyl-L-methionine synthase CmoA [Armatimonadetes bacterium]|nr:carboxy-S-adenosyl-L-methionine synthase CmoA [Armatimonadota bacterium]